MVDAILTANVYTNSVTVRDRLRIQGATQDVNLDAVIAAASREIDGLCNRFFYQLTETTRYYRADDARCLEVDDLVSVTEITTDEDGDRTYERTWSVTDYDLLPYNAADVGFPYTKLEITPFGLYGFPSTRKGIAITGTWGWPAVPAAISEATILQSIRIYKRAASPYGITGSIELGQQVFTPAKVDPQIQSLIASYRRMFVGAV